MTRFILQFVLAMPVLALAWAAQAQEFEKNMLTGGPQGTYIQIGRDIAAISAECGYTLNIRESAGSLENFVGVRQKRNTQFGIVQSDVLEYLKTYEANDPEIQRAVAGVRIMFPLYDEEVHLLARREIGSLAELSGQRVAVGKKDSGTFLTASLVLDLMRIDDADRVAIGADAALEQLLQGDIDALFYVAGAPTSLFANDEIDGSRFHLVDMRESVLTATYLPAVIPANTYPFQKEEVESIAVKAVLMTFEYDPKRNRYHRQSCKAVSDTANLILTRLDSLQRNGHPKWKSVDLAQLPPGWKVGSCVKAGMAIDYDLQCAEASESQPRQDEEYLDLLKKRLKGD